MSPPLETYVVVSMAFAVFAAVTAVGAAIVLGVGYERLRAGLERVKEGLDVLNRQTGFFSTAIFKLEQRVDDIDPSLAKPVISDDAPVKAARKSTKGKSRAKKTRLDAVQAQPLETSVGGITVANPEAGLSESWQSYQGLSKDEALANFAKGGPADSKVRFM